MLKEREMAKGTDYGGKPSLDGHRAVPSNPPPKLSDLGITKNQSSQWQAVASLPEEVFEEHIEETKAKKKELTTSDMVKLAKKEEKLIENEELRKRVCPLPEGQYSVVLADPPWEYSFSRSANRRISNQYPTLSLDEIKAFVTQDIFAKDCVLFLWVPSPKAEEGFEVLKAWGFTYKTSAVWDKLIIGMGYYFRQQHEWLLVGTKGSLPVPKPSARVSSIIESRRGKHSQKPTKLYKIIE